MYPCLCSQARHRRGHRNPCPKQTKDQTSSSTHPNLHCPSPKPPKKPTSAVAPKESTPDLPKTTFSTYSRSFHSRTLVFAPKPAFRRGHRNPCPRQTKDQTSSSAHSNLHRPSPKPPKKPTSAVAPKGESVNARPSKTFQNLVVY